MPLYLVVHSPRVESEEGGGDVRPPTRLRELAQAAMDASRSARWLKAWSPDLHDDRIFTLWEADSAENVQTVLEEFGFLDDLDSKPVRVREWGPADVLAEHR